MRYAETSVSRFIVKIPKSIKEKSDATFSPSTNARTCERVSERDITRIRASYVFQAEGRREGRKGRRGSRVGAGG